MNHAAREQQQVRKGRENTVTIVRTSTRVLALDQ